MSEATDEFHGRSLDDRCGRLYTDAARILGIGLSLGGPTGYAINPARDLGPRIAHAVLPIAGLRWSGCSWRLCRVALWVRYSSKDSSKRRSELWDQRKPHWTW
jgi:predicted peptidase